MSVNSGKIKNEERNNGVLGWSQEEDEYLGNLVNNLHEKWSNIATKMNTRFPSHLRTLFECRKRWQKHINKPLDNLDWSPVEELVLLREHRKYSNHWTMIASALQGRTSNTCKNKFYSLFKRAQKKIGRKQESFESELDLVEVQYVLSIIWDHFLRPTKFVKTKGKRGKDYIYSLIHKMSKEETEEYKAFIDEKTKNLGTIDEIMRRLEETMVSQEIPSPPNLPPLKILPHEPSLKKKNLKMEELKFISNSNRGKVDSPCNRNEGFRPEEPSFARDALGVNREAEMLYPHPTVSRYCSSVLSPVTLSSNQTQRRSGAFTATAAREPLYQPQFSDPFDYSNMAMFRAPGYVGDSPVLDLGSPLTPLFARSPELYPYNDYMPYGTPIQQYYPRQFLMPPTPPQNYSVNSQYTVPQSTGYFPCTLR
eukprot:TRINITY_DN10461_c0_g1_i2.p1 TRINITY_DN10461_c0_g1~~TRINITY_DN10461_c0_g1_i2.p1  ORF type:complete len:423 (-),score=51.52 TRINITY_DN10461_c0_g1_i2:198-1466(-)